MKLLIKRGICCLVIVTLLLGIVPFAMAESISAGELVDAIIPSIDECFTTGVFEETCFISKDNIVGKHGSFYLNSDDRKMLSVGEEIYRTYTFSDEAAFLLATGFILSVFDEISLIDDWDVRLYFIVDDEVSILSQEDATELAAVFATTLNSLIE